MYRDHSHGLTTKTLMKRNLHRISCTGPSTTDILAKGSCTAAYKGDPVKQILHAIFYGDLHNGNLQNLSLCRASLSAAVLWAPKRSQITLQCKPSARRAEKPWLCRIYPGISSSCSLQHCSRPLAGVFLSRQFKKCV